MTASESAAVIIRTSHGRELPACRAHRQRRRGGKRGRTERDTLCDGIADNAKPSTRPGHIVAKRSGSQQARAAGHITAVTRDGRAHGHGSWNEFAFDWRPFKRPLYKGQDP